jgi:hypothetical protein
MITLLKRSVVAAALAAALAAPAMAQGWMMQDHRGPGMMQGDGGWGHMMGMGRMMMGDPGRHMGGRLAFIEAELGVTEAQRPLWDAYAKAVRGAAASMAALHGRMQGMQTAPSLPERLALMEEMMANRLAALQTVRGEATALYEALSPAQREVADSIMGMGMGPM